MSDIRRHSLMPTLTVVLAIHVAAFVFFHLCLALIFDIRFVRVDLAHPWVGGVVITLSQTIRYLPCLLFVGMIIRTRHHRGVLAIMCLATLYSGHYFSYPLLTGFLYSIDQIEEFPTFLFDQMPSISEYPPLSN